MTISSRKAALAAVLLASVAFPAAAEPVFNRIASFPVAQNLPDDKDKLSVSSAEIITATDDGNTLIYSDSPLGAIGFIDITDAKAPKAGGAVMMDGEPTSVTSSAGKALVAVNTSESKAKPSGRLAIVDVATRKIESTCDLGGQPDSIALNKDKTLGAIAIENERDEEVNDGKIPQMPAGDLVVFQVKNGAVDCGTIKHVALTGLAGVAPEDPEPEFVAFNGLNEIALTLQENNEIVIIDANTAAVKTHFSAGSVDLTGIDTKRDGALKFSGESKGVLREPDAVKWLDDNRLLVANEGDYQGGSRGFTIFDKTGKLLYESGASSNALSPISATIRKAGRDRRASSPKVSKPPSSATSNISSCSPNAPRSSASTRTPAPIPNSSSCCRPAFRRKARSPFLRAICLRPPTNSTSARTAVRAHM